MRKPHTIIKPRALTPREIEHRNKWVKSNQQEINLLDRYVMYRGERPAVLSILMRA